MSLSSSVDTLLDRTIALGYGNVGLLARERLPGWPADPPPMDGRSVLITGAAGGLGLAAAKGHARLGATVHALARSDDRAADAVRAIESAVPGAKVRAEVCDVSSLEALRAFAADFKEREERLDVLVNNAGVMPDDRERSADGIELMFATHVLAAWVLIDELQDLLRAAAPGRVITVSSGGQYDQSLPEDDLQSEDDSYGPKKLYARTKRAQVILTEQWAERLGREQVVVHSMHPGWADTEGVRNWMPLFRAVTRPIIRTPEQGADTIVWLGGAPEPLESTGDFWHDRRRRPTTYLIGAGADSPEVRTSLWLTCERLAGKVNV